MRPCAPRRKHAVLVLVLPAWLAAAVGLAGQDVVFVASDRAPEGQIKYTGEILDYTGEGLRLRTELGVERTVADEQIRRIETDWLPPHRQAAHFRHRLSSWTARRRVPRS